MTTLLRSATLLAIATGTLHAQEVVGRRDATFSIRQMMERGERLHVTSPNGAIAVTQGSGSELRIQIEKSTDRGGRITDIGFVVKRSGGSLIVCGVIDDDDRCEVGSGYRRESRGWNGGRQLAKANFTVVLPAGVSLRTDTGNGELTITGVTESVEANTGNGRMRITGTLNSVKARTGNGRVDIDDTRGIVDVSSGNGEVTVGNNGGPVTVSTGNGDVTVTTASGPVSARSGNGDIDVTMAQVRQRSPMTFSTGNGRISLKVPDGYGAELVSSTGSGRITTDIPIRVEGRVDPHRLRGTLGDGGEQLSISTGHGDITIRRAGQ